MADFLYDDPSSSSNTTTQDDYVRIEMPRSVQKEIYTPPPSPEELQEMFDEEDE